MMPNYLQEEFIPIDIEGLQKCEMDIEQFNGGLEVGSYYAGLCSALFNCGLSEDNITTIVQTLITQQAD